jgi:ribonuclease HI
MPLIHSLSDHAPILLSTDGLVRKVKSTFKFENWWLKEDDFQDYAKSNWINNASHDFSFRTKKLAGALKIWCKKKKPLDKELQEIDEKLKEIQQRPVQQQDRALEENLVQRYEHNLTKLTDFYAQRAKKAWLKDGDKNTAFFHKAIAKRKRRNTIVSIKDENNAMHYLPHAISNTFVNYFRHLFSSQNVNIGRLPFDSLPPLPCHDYTYSTPDKQELLQTLLDMKRNASPGPDGFNVEFYISTWNWIGDDVCSLVSSFYNSATFPAHLNDTHIALIPKKLVPIIPADYRPISLCNVIYKLIAKSLANRLKQHLPDYVHPAQQAFIKGRRISNNIIVAQEITHSFALSSWKEKCFMLKIDLAKAFDRVEWNFIVSALVRKELHGHFINLIYTCISSPAFSIIINGQPFHRFTSGRGIRQGCPLSPYLFVLAINELPLALQQALSDSSLDGIVLGPNCPPIHSLLFADDLLICGKADPQQAIIIKQILQTFCARSGQMPSWEKSGIIFSKHVDQITSTEIRNIFPVPMIDSSFIHLGHPLILPGKDRASAYDFVLHKFQTKFSTYKADQLSHAARLALIQSVFSSIPVYYMSNILFPKKFIAKITSIVRNFWWTGISNDKKTRALCLRAWTDICSSKKEGGLGIRNFQAINQSLILMTAWRVANNEDSFLHDVLKSKYFHQSSIWRPNSNTPKSAFWASVLKILPILKAHSYIQITHGNISLWSSPWCTEWASIYDYLIIQQPNFIYPAKVSDLWLSDQNVWNEQLIRNLFQQPMSDHILQTQIINTQNSDLLCWKLTPNGKCNAKSAYYACLQNLQENGEQCPTTISPATKKLLRQVWKEKKLIPRVKTFAWRFIRRAIPTGARAGRYSKHINKICCRCGLEEDDLHLFFTCTFVKAAWFMYPWFIRTEILIQGTNDLTHLILKVLNLPHPYASLQNVFNFLWCIWKSRNDALFRKENNKPHQIHLTAQALSKTLDLLPAATPLSQSNVVGSNEMQTHIFRQGSSLPTDLIITGPKIYTDAAWKKNRNSSGIGIFIEFEDAGGKKISIMIQAVTQQASSVLQAETMAMILALQVTQVIGVIDPTFLTDSKLLAMAMASKRIDADQMHWTCRHNFAQALNLANDIQAKVFHIKRQLNSLAHCCAHQALKSISGSTPFGCTAPAHRSFPCPISSLLLNFNREGFVIKDVHCF